MRLIISLTSRCGAPQEARRLRRRRRPRKTSGVGAGQKGRSGVHPPRFEGARSLYRSPAPRFNNYEFAELRRRHVGDLRRARPKITR